jgi:hypothetical protein
VFRATTLPLPVSDVHALQLATPASAETEELSLKLPVRIKPKASVWFEKLGGPEPESSRVKPFSVS